ncbi:MAG: cystathionine beta-synthase [Candidatus Heimdallarchaeota archaeon]
MNKCQKTVVDNQQIANSILDLIGNTPLLKLTKLTRGLNCNILAKLEFLNPGGSVKDRIGIAMIEAAEKQGIIEPGFIIVEPTSGNTGVGLALAALVKGYKMIFTLPDKMSQEKIDLLRAFGAKVIVTPTAVAPDHPSNYVKVAERIVKETPNSFMPNQYFNQSNPQAHYQTTGPEIWEQTAGRIDVLVSTMGTGGTISGTSRYLKEKNSNLKVVGVDPEGSLYHHEFYGTKGQVHPYKVEGIGEDFLPSTLNLKIVDEIITVTDKEAFLTARRLSQEEGIFSGGSAGAAVFAALQVAKKMNENQNIVVILPDTGRNYIHKLYSDEWMTEKGFLESKKERIPVRDLLEAKVRRIKKLIYIDPDSKVLEAIALMKKNDVSQLPVIKKQVQIGSVSESTLMRNLTEHSTCQRRISEIMEPPLPTVKVDEKILTPFNFLKDKNGILVLEDNKIVDIITTIDVINYLMKR